MRFAPLVNSVANVIFSPHSSALTLCGAPAWRCMASDSPGLGTGLTRVLCIVVFVVMLAAVVYAAWIGISNYSRIHV